MGKYINIAVEPKTRAKIRLIAEKTNGKKSQIVDLAITEYAQKILKRVSAVDKKVIEA
jgi:predicted transcriptional regulator